MPYTTPGGAGNLKKLASSSLLMYFNLDYSNYLRLKYKAIASKTETEVALKSASYEFVYSEWKDLSFGKSYTYGTLDNRKSLFDGVACNDNFLYPKVMTSQSNIEF